MRKRGQISIFIIVAIVIVVVLILYFAVKGNLILVGSINSEIEPIYLFVDNCIEQVAVDSIYQVGQTGGYYLAPENSIDIGIAVYFDKGRNLMISKTELEEELEFYVDEMLFFCTSNFVDFPDFEVSFGEINSEVEVVEGKVVFNIKYPLSINKGDNTYVLDNFNKDIPSKLYTIYSVALNIIEEQMLFEKGVCMNCVSDTAYENKVQVFMNDYDNETIIFSLVDGEHKINDEDYYFYFANKYEVYDSFEL